VPIAPTKRTFEAMPTDPSEQRLPPPMVGAHFGEPPPGPRWPVVVAVVVVVAIVGALAVVWLRDDGDDAAPPFTTGTLPAPGSTASTQPGTTTGDVAQTSAGELLEPFFTAAATTDGLISDAAAAINAAGPPWATISADVADAVGAADPDTVAATIPAGLPPDLLQSVILVYSDLVSRRAAMQSFAFAGPSVVDEAGLRAELSNGHEAATRFDTDLAAARALAAAAPPVTVAPPDSREAAEALLLVNYVGSRNSGCDGRGGAIVTELPVVTWDSDTGGTLGTPPDTVGFQATVGPDGSYDVEILAC
jgi:hypothetical protein